MIIRFFSYYHNCLHLFIIEMLYFYFWDIFYKSKKMPQQFFSNLTDLSRVNGE